MAKKMGVVFGKMQHSTTDDTIKEARREGHLFHLCHLKPIWQYCTKLCPYLCHSLGIVIKAIRLKIVPHKPVKITSGATTGIEKQVAWFIPIFHDLI
jgi:hypothetical protein